MLAHLTNERPVPPLRVAAFIAAAIACFGLLTISGRLAAQDEPADPPASQQDEPGEPQAEPPAEPVEPVQTPAEPDEPVQPPAEPEQAPPESPADAPPAAPEQTVTTETGLQYRITKPAPDRIVARHGDIVVVHYTGQLEDGTIFETSLRPTPSGRRMLIQPYVFPLGEAWVIRGWDEGVVGMAVGERRTLIIPPELAYADRGAGNVIPPNATLIFEVELVGLHRMEEEQE